MLKRSIAVAISLLAGQATAQESYIFGGLGLTKADFEYTYLSGSESTSFDADGAGAFFGYGRVFSNNGKLALAGEVDVAFGGMKSDLILGTTTPCLISEEGCTGEVSALATLRLVAGASTGKLRPFASLGLAVGDVKGSADEGACGFAVCDYDERLIGLAASLGASYEVSESWRFRGEILYVNLGEPEFSFPLLVSAGDITLTQFRLGAQLRF